VQIKPEEPGNLRGLGIIVLRARDPERLAAYYSALGFQEAARGSVIGMWAGNGMVLEIGQLADTAPHSPLPTTRQEARHTTVVGVHNLDNVIAAARANGATLIEEWPSGTDVRLVYIGDPEGNLLGFMNGGPMFAGR
jgi:catechol 2,3-dioxygenase-like lactoylglutathione lyase family enzyme